MNRHNIKLRLTKIGFSNENASELSYAYIYSKLTKEDLENLKIMTIAIINNWYEIVANRIDSIIDNIKKRIISISNDNIYQKDKNIKNKIINDLIEKLNEVFDSKLYYTKNEFFESIIYDIEKSMKNNFNEKNLDNWINNHNYNTKSEYIISYIKLVKNEINRVLKNIENKVNEIANNNIYNLELQFKDILKLVTYEYI